MRSRYITHVTSNAVPRPWQRREHVFLRGWIVKSGSLPSACSYPRLWGPHVVDVTSCCTTWPSSCSSSWRHIESHFASVIITPRQVIYFHCTHRVSALNETAVEGALWFPVSGRKENSRMKVEISGVMTWMSSNGYQQPLTGWSERNHGEHWILRSKCRRCSSPCFEDEAHDEHALWNPMLFVYLNRMGRRNQQVRQLAFPFWLPSTSPITGHTEDEAKMTRVFHTVDK